MAYITPEQYRQKTLLPENILDAIEQRTPGWIAAQLDLVSARIFAQLGKRYGDWVNANAYPTVLGEWITRIMDVRALLKRGVAADDKQYETYKELHDTAWKEVNNAANSETGLFDLATEQGGVTSGIVRGAPLQYSEQSPYSWLDGQAEIGHQEDSNRMGTRNR